jgi:hypothetical protein
MRYSSPDSEPRWSTSVSGEVQVRPQVVMQHPVRVAEGGHGGHEPGKGVGPLRHGVVELAVAAEDLVRRLAGEGHRRTLADRLAEQVQRGVHVPEPHRHVASRERRPAHLGVGQRPVVEHDVNVVGADVPGHIVHVRRVRGGAQLVGLEVLRLADEVDREGPHPLALFGQLGGGQRGDEARVQTAGEQHATGHVSDELPAHDVVQQLPHMPDGGVAIVGVGPRLQSPVGALA